MPRTTTVPVPEPPSPRPDGACPIRDAGHCPVPCLLSGHTVGRLGTGAQLLLWALRRHRLDGAGTASLAPGFRLALGLGGVEPALAAFADLADALGRRPHRPLAVGCLRCALLSADEWSVVALVEAAGRDQQRAASIAALLVPAPDDLAALEAARRLARLLDRAGATLVAVTVDPGRAGRPH
jgi:hypothetical protein